jgi:hypothetical protein
MNRICGRHDRVSTASGGSRRDRRTLCRALVSLTLAGAVASAAIVAPASARAEPAKPRPEKLWQAYPLNPTRTETQRGQPAQQTGPAATPERPAPEARGGGGSSWWPVALALGGLFLLVLIGVVVVVTRLQPSVRWPSRDRVRAAVAPARDGAEAIASAASRGAGTVAQAVQRVPSVVAEHRPRMPHVTRPTLPRMPHVTRPTLPRMPHVTRPTLPRITIPTAAALTEPLLESVRAHVRRPAASEAAVVTPAAMTSPTEGSRSATPETEVLKRKALTARADEADKLRRKSSGTPLPRADEQRDVEVLKAKLASAEPAHEPERVPIRAPVELRPVRAVGSAAPAPEPLQPLPKRDGPRPAPRQAAPACRIDWWRGYRKSHFDARVPTAEGGEAVLLTSPPFRWSKPTPPPADIAEVARAHDVLVAKLKASGWVVTGRGKDWYALELRRLSELIDPAE